MLRLTLFREEARETISKKTQESVIVESSRGGKEAQSTKVERDQNRPLPDRRSFPIVKKVMKEVEKSYEMYDQR